MKNSKALFRYLTSHLAAEEQAEAEAIAYIVLAHVFSISRTDVLAEKPVEVSEAKASQLETILTRLNTGEPLQYVLGETEFYGRKFVVKEGVLIPRPETEELVRVVIEFLRSQESGARSQNAAYSIQQTEFLGRVLDVGTGSGCIPVTVALEVAGTQVFAVDISEVALRVARENALMLGARVEIVTWDILKDDLPWGGLDVIVSNPPYIPWHEKVSMRANVTEFEPHGALFVPDDDPLIFYKAIARQGARALRRFGLVAVEIHERFGEKVAQVFRDAGFVQVEIVKDIFGKERIVKGILG